MKDRILKIIVSALPIKMIVGYVLGEIEEYVRKTDNKIDDAVFDALKKLFEVADISATGVTLPKELTQFLKSFDFKDVLAGFIAFLEEKAATTENEFDDYLVKIFKSILTEFGLVREDGNKPVVA